jgi:hypothetical protein
VITGALATNLGASSSIAMTVAAEQWIEGTLNVDHTLTITAKPAGSRLRIKVLNTAGKSLTIVDGASSTTLAIPTTSGSQVAHVVIESDGTDLYVELPGGTGPAGANGTNGTDATISTVKDEGSALTARANLNFTGAGVTASDNSGTGATDVTIPGGLSNPMTAAGDIIVGGASGAPARLAKGTDGQVLKLASGTPSWAAESGGGSTNLEAAVGPEMHKLVGWNADVMHLTASSALNNGGVSYLMKVPILKDATIGNVYGITSAAGVGLTQAYASIYTLSGTTFTRVGVSANETAKFMAAAGVVAIPVTADSAGSLTFTAPRFIYVMLHNVGTTGANFYGHYGQSSAGFNLNLVATDSFRLSTGPTNTTTPPATFATSTLTAATGSRWVGVGV